MQPIDQRTEEALQDFKERLRSRYGQHLKAVYLFGSRVRGDCTPDSDADIAVFLDHAPDPLQEQLDLIDESFPILLSTGIHIQPWVFEEEGLKHPEYHRAGHLIKTIRREGIRV
jgi:predicted nucleotidyltransferase